jgi:hypothetical protein
VRRSAQAARFAFAAVWMCVARAAPAAPAATFEELARNAAPVSDLGMLLWPFVDDCRRSNGDLDRARCETVRGFLKARLPGRTFLYTREDAEAVLASGYDARTKAVRLTVAGCLACKQLVEVGPGERRYVTLKMPSRGTSGGPVAAEAARASVGLATAADADRWTKDVQPFLRVELVFEPMDQPWTIGVSRGYAFNPVGVRVSNRCTGEVVFSQPPSGAEAPRDSQCAEPAGTDAAEAAEEPAETLAPAAINQALGEVRGALDACVDQFKMPGTARLVFVVAASGLVQSVKVQGSVAGTPLADCLSGVARKVSFPAFRGPVQRFTYPVTLRR